MNGESDGKGTAKLRKTIINLILNQAQRDLILFQECIWENPLKHITCPVNFKYEKVGKEAGIIWNPDVFEVQKVEIKDDFKHQYQKVIENRGRLCVCDVEYNSTEQKNRADYHKERGFRYRSCDYPLLTNIVF